MLVKLLSIGLILCLVFSIPFSTYASSLSNNKTYSQIVSEVTTLISNAYTQKDLGPQNGQSFVTSSMLSSDIASYLSGKISTQQYVTQLYNTNKENYSIAITLQGSNVLSESNILQLVFQVKTEYNYIGCDFDTEVNEIVEIDYDCETGKIVDFYTPGNYYDVYVHDSDTVTYATQTTESAFILSPNVASAQASIIDNINSVYAKESSLNISGVSPIVKRISTINANQVVSYARSNYYKDQPASGNGTVPYYDFSEITNSYDCTNFVSHALLSGGAKVYDPGGSGISSTGWYYRNLSNRSSSWSGVNQLYNYLVNNTRSNTAAGMSFQYSQNGAYWGPGDVLQFSSSSTSSSYVHSTIITEKRKSNDGTRAYAYVTGRTGDGRSNNNQAASDIYPNGQKRTIKVYNN